MPRTRLLRYGCASMPMSRSARSSISLRALDRCPARQMVDDARRPSLRTGGKIRRELQDIAGRAAVWDIVDIVLLQLAFDAAKPLPPAQTLADSGVRPDWSDCLHSLSVQSQA